MCSVLDDAVLNTSWGADSAWGQRTLLTIFHGETSGGEKCFLILDKLLENPRQNLSIIQLFFMALNLGFEGKYKLVSGGAEKLYIIKRHLYSIICEHDEPKHFQLSDDWQGVGSTKNSLTSGFPLWLIAGIFTLITFFSYVGFKFWINASSQVLINQLKQLAL